MNTYIVTTSPILKKAMLRSLCCSGADFSIEKEFNNGIYLLCVNSIEGQQSEEIILNSRRYIKHINKVDFKSIATGDLNKDFDIMKTFIDNNNFNVTNTFSVQVRNLKNPSYTAKDMEVKVGSYIESNFKPKAYFNDIEIPKDIGQKIMSVLIFDKEFYVGIGNVKENLYPVSDPYRIFSRWQEHICRSEFKLREALQLIGYEPRKGETAVDLGAAPGGWSFVLAEYGMNVIAVDPAELDVRLSKIREVSHFKGKSQDFKTDKKINLLVNDMNMEPRDSAEIVLSFSKNLHKGTMVIMTIKLVNGPYDQRIQEVLDTLKNEFKLIDIRLLFHNRQEVTSFFEKK